MKYIKEMRIKHYIKNGLIFVPAFFAGSIFEMQTLTTACLAFLSFCLMSSAIYVLNDLNDAEKDRLHPKKKHRPIASGAIGNNEAVFFSFFLMVVSIALVVLTCRDGKLPVGILLLYLFINLIYSVFGGKNVALLDVALLVSGFYLRLLMGSVTCKVEISNWLSLVVIAGSFFLAFGKRRNESRQTGAKTRAALEAYSVDFLDRAMYSSMTLSLAFFALWCEEKGSGYMVLFPLVMLIMLRYCMNVEKAAEGDPTTIILKDYVLLGLVFLLGAIAFALIYVSESLPF
ncbi:UbiA prenyltransferase family protein [Oscillibacter sp. GMB15532]|uniref:UbiA prenyltransferase family protein n=1 Tax=Oscillibacter sp. GMB15532 TaxID=3230022 RepID=UPI0034DFD84E